MNIGQHLKEWRGRCFIMQEELAPFLGVTAQTISNWEQGRNSPPAYLPLSLAAVESIVCAGHLTPVQIRGWRERQGLTQAQMAGLLGVHHGTIYAWEKGRSRPAPALAAALLELERRHAPDRFFENDRNDVFDVLDEPKPEWGDADFND